MQDKVKTALITLFGERVAFHRIERLLYARDLGTLPDMVTGRIKTMPDAVVQPQSTQELTELLALCARNGIPIVPRGAGSAGYGGAVPASGGIVVDFIRMNKVLAIDTENMRVTVEPGAVLDDLEKELRGHGLALRLYPGSAISATVGGWLANGGGVGIGSYEYGFLRNNIVDVELVTPAGLRRISKDVLGLVEGMAGTTGLISRVTLLVREDVKDVPVAASFPTLQAVAQAFKTIGEKGLPLWEVGYKDSLQVELTGKAARKQAEKGPICHQIHEPVFPKERLIVTFVYPENRNDFVASQLAAIIEAAGGEVLPEELAGAEWADRFHGMRLKALGPSLIPTEVIVPASVLPEFVERVRNKVKDLAFSGTLVSGGKEAVFLGVRLDDERRQGFALAFADSIIPLKTAQALGGRPYTVGMLLSNYAEACMGRARLHEAFAFKKKVDPEGILNPGKVFPASLDKHSPTRMLNRLSKLASGQIGAMKAVDKLFGGKSQGMSLDNGPLRKMPFGKELAWDAFSCANCGYCRSTCTQFRAIGWESASPRGKFHFLREYIKGNVPFDERMAEMFFTCTTCGRCNDTCQIRASIDEEWSLTMRPHLWQQGFNPPEVHQGNAHNIAVHHNPGGVPQAERRNWMTPDLKWKEEGEIGYFAGCSASFSASTRNLAVNALRLLNKAGVEPVYLGENEWCCGGSLFYTGCLGDAAETVQHNINEMTKRGVKTLYTSCSGCWLHLAHFYPVVAKQAGMAFDITVRHITQGISDLIEAGRLACKFPVDLKVTYHDPCHIGHCGGIYDEPRKILAAIPGLELIEMANIREEAACCGRHVMRYPRLGMAIHGERLKEAAATGVPALIGACPTCETNFRIGIAETKTDLEIFDITDLVCQSVGLPTLVMTRFMKLGIM